ncbi:MAG: 5-bromo-4-chloroindolyl phosphate hydrolysis family protein [Gemmobacter sp.]
MAKKFGGKFSPDGAPVQPLSHAERPAANPFDGRTPGKVGFRANLLFALPFLFAWRAFLGRPEDLIAGLGTFAALMLAAWLTREGIVAHEAYDARNVARRPAIPRKIFGSVLTGAGLGLATVYSGHGLLIALAFGAIGAALHLAAFGPDPLADKGATGIDAFQSDRVAGAVDEAERHLAAMRDAILRAGDRRIEGRVDRFIATARAMFRTVEADPRDLTAARKYLGVYLMGARDASVKFADHYARSRDPQALADYETLLDDLERNFADRTQKLLADGKTDLNVEIEVLRERLAREG